MVKYINNIMFVTTKGGFTIEEKGIIDFHNVFHLFFFY